MLVPNFHFNDDHTTFRQHAEKHEYTAKKCTNRIYLYYSLPKQCIASEWGILSSIGIIKNGLTDLPVPTSHLTSVQAKRMREPQLTLKNAYKGSGLDVSEIMVILSSRTCCHAANKRSWGETGKTRPQICESLACAAERQTKLGQAEVRPHSQWSWQLCMQGVWWE